MGLDSLLKVSYRRGNVVLVAGHPGSGKNMFGAQFLYRGAVERGEAGVYVSFAEPREEFYSHMKALGLDFEHIEAEGRLRFMEFLTVSDERAVTPIADQVFDAAAELGAERLVIDPISVPVGLLSKAKARAFLHSSLINAAKELGLTTMLIADLPRGAEAVGYGFEEFVADVVIKLTLEEAKGLTRRVMTLYKVRDAPVPRVSYEFDIVGGRGIELFIPLEAGFEGKIGPTRVSTGVEVLDRLLGGGLFKGSATLLTGASGTGKTTLASIFAAQGVEEGGRVLYLSFEEPVEQLNALLASLGRDVESLKRGLRILSISPRLSTPGALYFYVERLVEEVSPNRLVVDSLTSLSRQYEEAEFLELARSLVLLCKKKGITSLLTSREDVVRGEEAPISTMVDNIIALWLDFEGEEVRRRVAVVKERMSPHDQHKHTLIVEKGEVVIR
mgnify:CR=1 FL=1